MGQDYCQTQQLQTFSCVSVIIVEERVQEEVKHVQ